MGIVVLCLYAAALFFLTFRVRKGSTEDSFFVNSRSSGPFGVGFAIVAACVGASATIGVVGMAFTLGTPAFWWSGVGAAGLLVLGIFLAGKVRRTRAATMPQIVEKFLGASVRPLVSAVIVAAWLAILAAEFSAARQIVASLTALPAVVCLLISTALIVVHTSGGGQAAIMRLGGAQSALKFGGLAVALGWLTWRNPRWFSAVSIEPVNALFPVSRLVYYCFIIGGGYIVCPMLYGRLLSAKDVKSARHGAIIAAGGLACSSVLIVCVGLACRGMIPADTLPDAVLTVSLASVLPGWLNVLTLLALLCAIVSAADACLLTAGTILSRDLLQRQTRAVCRVCVIVLGGLGAALSFMNKSIIDFLLMSYDIYVCGVVLPVLIGIVTNARRDMDPRFAFLAVLAGGILGGVSSFSGSVAWSYAGLAASLSLTLFGLRGKRANNPRGEGATPPVTSTPPSR